ncbi:hypothetical protein OIU78_004295 [Salix suchowensis]|nr:hypothetical protein OIU78_004295 [Salix suchowensis]
MWPCPLDKVMLSIRSVLIHGSSASYHFKQDHTETVDVTP